MSGLWVGVGSAVVGGLASYAGSKKQADAMKEAGKADPRFNALLWGEKDKPGLMNHAQDWYEANASGLNPQILQGMNDQWGVLTDPNLRAGYNNMSNMGNALMTAPIAGNPFTDGKASLDRPFNPMQFAAQNGANGFRSQGTLMAPGLLNSSMIASGPEQTKPLQIEPDREQLPRLPVQPGQPAQSLLQPVIQPVAFGSKGSTGSSGSSGNAVPGPFTMPTKPEPEPEAPKPKSPGVSNAALLLGGPQAIADDIYARAMRGEPVSEDEWLAYTRYHLSYSG